MSQEIDFKNKEDKHEIDERLDNLLKIGWIMLPESCSSPCKKITNL
jgi:hypothetical protein